MQIDCKIKLNNINIEVLLSHRKPHPFTLESPSTRHIIALKGFISEVEKYVKT